MASKTPLTQLSLHTLLVALSYWGTAVRVMLFGFVLFVATALAIMNGGSMADHSVRFIYLMFILLCLDAGYVTVARALPVSEIFDRAVLLMAFLVMALVAILPYFVVMSNPSSSTSRWLLLPVLLLLAIRLVVGMVYNPKKS